MTIMLQADGIGDWLSDTSDDVLKRIAAGATVRYIHRITAEEFAQVEAASAAILRLEHSFQYKLLEANYVHLVESYELVTVMLQLGREFGNPDRTRLGETVMGALANWLSAMRMYLDHQELAIKRAGNAQHEADFAKATSAAFDQLLGYRFAYKLRNFVQHCGLPLASIELTASPVGSEFKQQATLVASRQSLLEERRVWGPVARDIDRLPESFDLQPLLAEAMVGIRQVEQVCFDGLLDHAVEGAPVILSKASRIVTSAGELPTAFRVVKNGDRSTHGNSDPTGGSGSSPRRAGQGKYQSGGNPNPRSEPSKPSADK
ncbi:hypothetical protein [Nakamurella multipartita]|uniref:Uncharacterized protein n=1 Tax=Nakamurella multipartita (strain ATCC 700099 / DSM 44233 / CIP 104796 / JCM 9543 / NBRC 105858 / Y-104) TaxID=479431 RepID=C8XHD7_NAKMY|nr:hypothetical protein [Nakamurella multipartita]ACV78343.1 hypothetical protein Namu_1954 [Nakamurella multipartita DSM 44233]